MSKKGTISEQSLVIADEIAHDNVRYKRLINDNATKLAQKLALMADSIEDAQDMKHLVEANDKLSITLKVNERHAPKAVTAIQVNNEDKEVKSGVGELYKVINE